MQVFEKANIGNCELDNRIIRSATYEGRCDEKGVPGEAYSRYYEELSRGGMGAIITGFAFISQDGRAMQPRQAGMDAWEKVPYFAEMTDKVHSNGVKIFLQLAHTGRQTLNQITGRTVVGCSTRRSSYFRSRPRKLTKPEILKLAAKFGDSAGMAKEAGFDGVQIHAAHGYLLHQFILPSVNTRKDEFGTDKLERIGKKFLKLVIRNIRRRCGSNFPLLIKVSGGDDYFNSFTRHQFVNLIHFLDKQEIDAIEVSYGTMDYALSIFRGDFPVSLILKNNPFYKDRGNASKRMNRVLYFPLHRTRVKSFTPMYNLDYAKLARTCTQIPVISVGGFRSGKEINQAICDERIDFVSMSRPFIAEPDLVTRLRNGNNFQSKCNNCNYCAIMCDTPFETKCYK